MSDRSPRGYGVHGAVWRDVEAEPKRLVLVRVTAHYTVVNQKCSDTFQTWVWCPGACSGGARRTLARLPVHASVGTHTSPASTPACLARMWTRPWKSEPTVNDTHPSERTSHAVRACKPLRPCVRVRALKNSVRDCTRARVQTYLTHSTPPSQTYKPPQTSPTERCGPQRGGGRAPGRAHPRTPRGTARKLACRPTLHDLAPHS